MLHPSLLKSIWESNRSGWTEDLHQELGYKLNHIEHAESKRGKLVTFFKNGDPNFKGYKTSVSTKQFATFDTLLNFLSQKIPTSTGVRYIFLLPDKTLITDISQMANGRCYLVSSNKRIIKETYGNSKEKHWHNRPPSNRAFRKGETAKLLNGKVTKSRSFPTSRTSSNKSYLHRNDPHHHQSNKLHSRSEVGMSQLGLAITDTKPRVLTLISNTHRNSSTKVILNPKTTQTYDEVLADITDMLTLEYPPVSSLWTIRKPVKKVNGFSHLLRGLKTHESFLAVGQENVPFEALESPVHRRQKRQPVPNNSNQWSNHRQHHPPSPPPYNNDDDQEWNEDDFEDEDELLPPVPPPQKQPKPPPPQQRKALMPPPPQPARESYQNNHHLFVSPHQQPDSQLTHTEGAVSEMRASTTSPRMSPVMVIDKYNQKQYLLRKSAHYKNQHQQHEQKDVETQTTLAIAAAPAADPIPDPYSSSSDQEKDQYSQRSQPHNTHRSQPIRALPAPASRDVDSPIDSGALVPIDDTNPVYNQMPYYRPFEEKQSVTVHIHGFPRKFYAPRYGQHEPDGTRPGKKLTLDWVYGYRGRDMRNNLVILPTEELVYFVSAVGVIYDVKNNQQRHYIEHDEDITCIALHPDLSKPKVATGQMASHVSDEAAHVRVWDPLTLVTYAVVGVGAFTKSIGSIGFSTHTGGLEKGSLLMAIDEGEKHVMSVWNWQVDRLVAKTTTQIYRTSADTVVWGQFHPHDHTTLITFGKNHVFFWKLFWEPEAQNDGKILRDKKSGLFEADYLPRFVTSMAFSSSGDVITGDSNGRIVVWESNHEDAYVYNATLSAPMQQAHKKSVFVLTMLDDGTLLSGGGHNVKCWDSLNGYKLVRDKEVSIDYGFVRTVAPVQSKHGNNRLYVGTTQNCILHGTLKDIFEPLVIGPYEELWAMGSHPEDYTFVTAGVDHHVRKWDALNRALIWESTVEKPCLSLDLSPAGIVIALGTTVGRFIVLSGVDGSHVFSMQCGKAQLGVVKFSPQGEYIAIGSHDANIFIYEVEDEGKLFKRHASGVLKGHKNFVTHIDWSKNGRFIRTVSGDYDLCFWSVAEMKEVSAKSMRNEDWFTETCVLSFNNLGAWSNLSEGGDINTVDMAHNRDVMAVGENMGSIKLYKYPCTAERPYFYEQKRYSGHVTKLTFTFDDNFLITCGGKDAGILQWTLVNQPKH